MFEIVRAQDRGQTRIGWLDSRHTFSFGEYYNPRRFGYRVLRVINDDVVAGGAGFPMHPHRDMEIISYVVDGTLEHRDSLGNGSLIEAGDVQRMTAGSGIRHSEYNASASEPVRFLQIWIPPERPGLTPGYEQKHFDREERRGRAQLLASPDGADGSLTIHQDVRLYGLLLGENEGIEWNIDATRYGWLQVVRGELSLGDHHLTQGDGVALAPGQTLNLHGHEEAEILLFDLP